MEFALNIGLDYRIVICFTSTLREVTRITKAVTMNFKILFAIVGIIVSMAFSVSCDECVGIQQVICGSDGEVYNNGCDFAAAQEECPELEEVDCSEGVAADAPQ